MTDSDGGLVPNWPHDADGDALRRLVVQGVEIDKPCWVDFNIDFEEWPPSSEAIGLLISRFPDAVVKQEVDGNSGYILFQISSVLNYDWVVQMQKELSSLMSQFGGSCQSWEYSINIGKHI